MATLLNGVNEVLKNVDVLDSDSNELADLTDSGKQIYIDVAVQVLNEVLDELYSVLDNPKPQQLAEATITLTASDQDYALATDLVVLLTDFDLIDETNNHRIFLMTDDDAYRQLVINDLDQDDTGLPSRAAIRPTDGELWMDRAPTANEAGRVYKYRYNKDLVLSTETDTFPFSDAAFRALVPAAAELWRSRRHQQFDDGVFKASLGRAARLVSMVPQRSTWKPDKGASNITDPMQE